jgi:hypothetical protein
MTVALPSALETAQREAQQIRANRDLYLKAPLERILADAWFVDSRSLLAGLTAFHQERMARVPSRAQYPEAQPWVDYVRTVDREVQRLAELSDADLALLRSLHAYLLFRGFGHAQPAGAEKCRVAYLPESNHGRLHVKNVDDPIAHWRPEGKPTWLFSLPDQKLWSDGVGSGLHLDDEPPEIFPLPVLAMFRQYADDVPTAVAFLTRYSPFWGNCNILLHDSRKRSVAIEKCSYNYIEVFHPGPDGRSHISGMTCRDPQSPQGRYQSAQRQKYLRLFNRPADCSDNAFWDMCGLFERKLAAFLREEPRPAQLEGVIRLFTTPWPQGLNKTGQRIHPEQKLFAYTLISYVILLDERKLLRWQRGLAPEVKYPAKPEVFEF